jgi:hypothetical protein
MFAVTDFEPRSSFSRLGRVLVVLAALSFASFAFAASAQATGGSVMGWGYNSYGEVGDGSSGAEVETPVFVSGQSEATQVSGGAYHALALQANGGVSAWGYNYDGQLGNGTRTNSPVPTPVPGLSNVVQVAGGYYASYALLANGTVMAWGENEEGELGQGNVTGPELCEGDPCSTKPIPVPGLTNVIAIDAGEEYALALLSNGTVMFWGYDYYGESGNGIGIQTETPSGCYCVDHPVPVPGISNAVAISAGWYLGSALLADGTVKDWGYNYYGEVGNGTLNKTEPPACYCSGPVTVSGITGAKATASGGYHGLALTGTGGASAWGYNYEGELGNGTNSTTGCECIPLPGSVVGLASTQAISAGSYQSLALLKDGSVMGWGENEYGQLGDGTEEDRYAPVPVLTVGGVSSVDSSDYNGYAVVSPSQTLKVALAGSGSGTVGTNGILCPGVTCEGTFSQGKVATLRAEPSAGSAFAGFSGPCVGTGTCQVNMAQNQTVTATFGPPKGTAITSSKIKKKTATFSFSAPGAITGYECQLIRPKAKHHKKKHKGRKGGKASKAKKAPAPPKFAACGGPKLYKNLKPGAYTFKVRALDIVGADAVPAVKQFKIKAVKHKKHHKKKHAHK